MPNVYVVNNGGHDFSDAERFGNVIFCTRGPLNKMDIAQMFRELNAVMEDAEPDDFLVITSLTSLCSIATGILADKFGKVNFLIFENDSYIKKTVAFDSFNNVE